MKIFKIYYLSNNDFFNVQIVSNLASGNSFKGLSLTLLHNLTIQHVTCFIMWLPRLGLWIHTHTYTHCQLSTNMEAIDLYDQNREGRVVILGIETWCRWINYFRYTEAEMAFLSSGEKRKIQTFICMFGVSFCQMSGFLEAHFEIVPNKRFCFLHSSLVLCQGRHIWISES